MTQLRIQRKPEPSPRPTLTVVPMIAVLTAGLITTWTASTGHMAPIDFVREFSGIQAPALQGIKLAFVRHQTFQVEGRAWRLADRTPVSDFAPDELVVIGESRGFTIVANRTRGLADLSLHPSAFDRPYLALGHGRYAPLRWRSVP